MASYQSVATVTFASASSVVVPKPSGLAVDDLMIAHIYALSGTVTTPSGWTAVRNDTNGTGEPKSYVFRKFADSTDVAASNFTFSLSGTVTSAGAIWRISGAPKGTPIYVSAGDGDENSTSPTFTTTVTPITANSLILFLGSIAQGNSDSTVSGYALTTSSPTFSEAYDVNGGGSSGQAPVLCGAYGTRSATTATGNATFSIAGTALNPDSVGQILVILVSQDASLTETVTHTDTVRGALAVFVEDIVTHTDTLVSLAARAWTTLTKNISTWTNQNKNG